MTRTARLFALAAWLVTGAASAVAPAAQTASGAGTTAGADPAGDAIAAAEGEPLAARVRAAAADLLADRFPEAAPRLAPRVLRLSADVPAGRPVRLALTDADGVPSGHTRVDILTDAGRAGWALLYVAHFDSVVVARREIARGDTLDAGAVEVAWLDVTRFHGDPVRPADLDRADLPTARRSLRAGTALRQSSLAWPVAVDTGDRVRVRYRRGGLLLALDGAAREPGAVGDAIRVHCRATGATYRVRLTAPGEADWLETL